MAKRQNPVELAAQLTDREREVVRLKSLGCTIYECAAILQVAKSTADNHITSAMTKLGLHKAAHLVRFAIASGISTLDDTITRGESRRLKTALAS